MYRDTSKTSARRYQRCVRRRSAAELGDGRNRNRSKNYSSVYIFGGSLSTMADVLCFIVLGGGGGGEAEGSVVVRDKKQKEEQRI